jgi:superfamily II DNA helicase RecQ
MLVPPQHLGCGSYHAGRDAEDWMNQVNRWVSNGGFIVATSALGTGVDYPNIVHVLHVGVPYGIIDFSRESGRAGRGSKAVDSVIVAEEEGVGRAEDASQSVDKSVMRAFVYSKSCRRATMSSYLNRRRVECSMQDCAAYDRCGEGVVEWHR